MSEPTTEKMLEWLVDEETFRRFRCDQNMARAIADRLRATQWHKVTDDVPKEECEVLATDGAVIVPAYAVMGEFLLAEGVPAVMAHWMPLPAPPEGKKP